MRPFIRHLYAMARMSATVVYTESDALKDALMVIDAMEPITLQHQVRTRQTSQAAAHALYGREACEAGRRLQAYRKADGLS